VKPNRPPRISKEVLLLSADIVAASLAMWLALHARFGAVIPVAHQLPYQAFLPALIATRLVAAHAFGLYDFKHKLTPSDHAFAGCGAAAFGVGAGYALLVLIRLYYTQWIDVSRWVACFDAAFLAAWYAMSRTVVLVVLARNGYRVRAALVGLAADCDALAVDIRAHAPRLFELTDAITPSDDLAAVLKETPLDQAILTSFNGPQRQLQEILADFDAAGVELYLYPDLALSVVASARITSIAGLPLASLTPGTTSGTYRSGKRLFDAAAATFALLVAAPLCLVAAVAIKFTSPGPVFFTQERAGLRGRSFQVVKFRTMTVNAEAHTGPVLSAANDARVTPIGRVLRRYRIDELPQLWNVVKGDMSLVGPRPERPEFAAQFTAETPLYERRLLIKPGLTGLAQIHGRYDTDYAQKLRYDLAYLNSISFATDLRILAATVRIVVTGKGAV